MNKIDICEVTNNLPIETTSMKPIYSINDDFYGVIEYNNKTYILDLRDRDRIINEKNKFDFINDTDDYPSYCYNYKRINYLEFIFSFGKNSVYYVFKNSNKYDLRRCNVEIYHWYHKFIIEDKKYEQYEFIEYIKGHYYHNGHDANIMKNPIWKVKDKSNGKEYLLMYCEKDTICKLCYESYQKILEFENTLYNKKKLTWFNTNSGYILGTNNLYIHQVITNCYGNGAGTKIISVDHIDQNPLNNTFENLRVATRQVQELNSKGIKDGTKREKKGSAIELPNGITQNMMKKYVVYYHEWLNKEHTKERDFFKVEKHPKLDKHWIGTKSGKVTILEKLEQVNKVVEDLEKDIYPYSEEPTLPKYISLTNMRDKPHLVFEKRINEKRLNVKMVLPESYDLMEQLEIFVDKINKKYVDLNFQIDKS